MPPASTTFNPPEPLAEAILAAITDPSTSFNDLAATHKTTVEALTLWLTRPDIAERLESLHHAFAARIRLIAANLLPQSLGALSNVLTHTRKQIEADAAAPPDKQRTPDQRQRTLETSRRAASRMVSLANFRPIPLFSKPVMGTTDRSPATMGSTDDSRATLGGTGGSPASGAREEHPISSQPRSSPALNGTSTNHTPPRQPGRIDHHPQRPVPTNRAATLLQAAGSAPSLRNPPHEHWP